MKRTLIAMGVFTALLCTLAFAATGQGPISQIKRVFSSADKQASKLSTTKLKINEESLALAMHTVHGKGTAGKAAAPSRINPSNQVKTFNLWRMEGGIMQTYNGADYDASSNTISLKGDGNSFNSFLTLTTESEYLWVSQYNKEYTFTGKLKADGDAVVRPCILFMGNDENSNLYIANQTEIGLNAANNYTSEFSVTAAGFGAGTPLFVAFLVERSNSSINIQSTNNDFYYSFETLVAEKWNAENNLPGLGITEGMAENAYTIVCADSLTTLGLYLDGETLCMVGMNTTATSFRVPMSIFIGEKEYNIGLFGKPNNESFDWSGSQSLTSLDLAYVEKLNLLFANSSVTDLFIYDGRTVNVCDEVSNIYLHLPYAASRNEYKDLGFRRTLMGDEQPSYPNSVFLYSWVMPGEREGDYFGVLIDQGYMNLVEIFTQEESITLPATTKYYDSNVRITRFGYAKSTQYAFVNAPNLKSLTIPGGYQNLNIEWEKTAINEIHLKGEKPQTAYQVPSNVTVYAPSREVYDALRSDGLWNSAKIKPEGWELNRPKVVCDDGLTTLEFESFDGQLSVVNIITTAATVTIPDSVTIDGQLYKVDMFGESSVNTFDWTDAQSVTKLDLTNVPTLRLSLDGSSVTDLCVGSGVNFAFLSDVSQVYLHMPYGESRDNYLNYGFKRILIGEEQPSYPEPSNSSYWVIAGEREGDYFSISYNSGEEKFRVAEIFTAAESVTLPETTRYTNGQEMPLTVLGANSGYWAEPLVTKAANLKSVVVPGCYNEMHVNWNYTGIRELRMKGAMPSSEWDVPSECSVYVSSKESYDAYAANDSWKNAELLPDGWDFDWMAVNVKRKGEFAQTYIEMNDADWSQGVNVKVIGALNGTDLSNIKKLTKLRKLDLSDATFDALPSSFISNNSTLQEVTLPASVKFIPRSAFEYCKRLGKLTAQGVDSIAESAFRNCERLTDFDISAATYIGVEAFNGCTKFVPAALSPELRYLGAYAFANTAVAEMTIPDGITAINNLFSGCSNLRKVTLPKNLLSIGNETFSRCSALAEITIPESVTEIGSNAFNSCSALTELTIPSKVEKIGYGALQSCTALVTVKCKAIVPPVATSNFTNGIDLNHCTLYIAPFTIDAYRAAENWDQFYIMKPLNEPVKNIYVKRPMTFDLLSEDNAVLQDNPNMALSYNRPNNYNSDINVGQLSASGDGTLSAGVFTINNMLASRSTSVSYYGGSRSDIRPTLINNAENMRADSVLCTMKLEKDTWHFISFQYDVQMSDIAGLNGTDFVIRQYNSAKRAAAGEATETNEASANWEDVPADGVLLAGKGYIIQVANNSTDANGSTNDAEVVFPSRNTVTKNRLFTSADVIVPLEEFPAEFAHNRSWNLVGNPYPCYFDLHSLKDGFYTPIVLWRGYDYQAYSPVDDNIILRPNESFFVQRPIDVEQMVFSADGRMHYDAAFKATYTDSQKPGVAAAPARSIGGAERNVFNFTVEGCGSDNRARIVMNEKATMGYDTDRDAAKFFAATAKGAEIYIDGDVKYDICERPFGDGTAKLAMRTGTAGEYTITLSGRYAEGWTVMLTDVQTGSNVNLCEGSYRFDAAAGTTAGRFLLTFKAPDANGIDAISAEIGADAEVNIVNAAGMTVFNGRFADFKGKATAGVYVIVCDGKTYKTVIK